MRYVKSSKEEGCDISKCDDNSLYHFHQNLNHRIDGGFFGKNHEGF